MARTPRARSLGLDAITVEGALIAPAMLETIAGQPDSQETRNSYGVPPGLTLRDHVSYLFKIARGQFEKVFTPGATPSGVATAAFAEALLRDVFGFGDIARIGHREHAGRVFPITMEAHGGRVPVMVVPPGDALDRPSAMLGTDRRRSAVSALQDWLNASQDALWGLCTNGSMLRLARDNASLTRPAYIEADLGRILGDGSFADFLGLWLLIHASRFPSIGGSPSDCQLERWRDEGAKQGVAARNKLRDGVEAALVALGTGFLAHSANADLRERLRTGSLKLDDFFGQLLRLVYRLIFLLTAEDRDLLHPPGALLAAKRLYVGGYALTRLRDRAVRRAAWDAHDDAWAGLLIVFAALAHGEPRLGLPALDGLFARGKTPDLDTLALPNRALMQAMLRLAWIADGSCALAPVNWRDMQTEELGSVYEALLELTPRLADEGRTLTFAEADESRGHARKTSGSYYTPDALVQLLLDSALDPVLDRVEAEAEDTSAALLGVRVIDPACGSGHFLLAGGRRIAARLARAREGGVASVEAYRHALRDVTRNCLHGVDRNPLAVELAQVALWIETVDPGRPLGYLDQTIKCGDSLLGIFDFVALEAGIPGAAYKPLTGDDRATADFYKRRNREELRGQGNLFAARAPMQPLAQTRSALRALPEESPEEIARKRQRFAEAARGAHHLGEAADLYVAAFLVPKRGGALELGRAGNVPTTADVWAALADKQRNPRVVGIATEASHAARAFHWPLEFPDVMAAGGFDVVLGNPPWEVMQLGEEEYFAQRLPEIAELAGAKRKRAIANLEAAQPTYFAAYQADKRRFDALNEFARESGRFDLTARGKINTYGLFAELFAALASPRGRAGVIVPTGIATDATTAPFFASLIDNSRLARLIDFENRAGIFPAIDSRIKFSLLTIGRGVPQAEFAFFLTAPEQLSEPARQFTLASSEIGRINPNTKTAPIFRSRRDAELTARICSRVPVLIEKQKGSLGNPWSIEFRQGLFNMTSDSGLFRTAQDLRNEGYTRDGADWVMARAPRYVPLYEAKMIHQFDHRWATYDDADARDVTGPEKKDSNFEPSPRYWVQQIDVEERLSPLPKAFLEALREGKVELVALLVAQFLFARRLAEAGYPERPVDSWAIFQQWIEFVARHEALRGIAPARIGLVGDNPPLMQPSGPNSLPAEPIHAVVATDRQRTAWYDIDANAIGAVVNHARQRHWMKEPHHALVNEGDVLAFGAWMRSASCPRWLLGWRDICRSTDERTVIATAFPVAGVGNNLPLMLFSGEQSPALLAALQGCLSSLACDFFARHKVGGTHLNFFIYEQLPILPPSTYSSSDLAYVVPRVLELTYTSHSMTPFALDVGYDGPPFVWDEDRRAQLRAELDAFYARAYGLTRDELRYILDPADVLGPDYPSETFRVLKTNEMRRYGEYRTARLVLAAWDALEASGSAVA